jgi:citrate synthase
MSENGTAMDVLRTVVSASAAEDPAEGDNSRDAEYQKAVRLTAKLPTILATYIRRRKGQQPVPPDASLGHAANFARMAGVDDHPRAAEVLNTCFILQAEHGLNASTFTARIVAATEADMHAAVTAAFGALKGPLHGGANAEVMKMLIEIGQDAPADRIDAYIKGKLARKEKISGFGHRVYNTEDPRATHLRKMSKELGQKAGNTRWYEMSERIEALIKSEKKLYPNVDFYSASTYYTMGIAIDLYTPIFAVSRISGWTAHVLEQLANNRLIRPRADYTGPSYPQTWIPLDQR